MKKPLMVMLLMLICVATSAQQRKITGLLSDRDTREPMAMATVQLLKADSTYVLGTTSKDDGVFTMTAPANGKFILKMSSVGYTTLFKNIEVKNGADLALGSIEMTSDVTMLKETTVKGQALKVVVKDDTLQYNAAAYRTPEGSVIEELVKRLPGAKVDDDGKITINGREVKKIKVDGKEFMTGDTKTAMKNLPTSIVEKVKAYDEKSDLSRVTGIDDGNETTVLDFGLKRGMNKGVFSNVQAGYGTHDRYTARAMGAYFNSDFRTMAFGNANNTNDMGFPGGGGRGNFGRGRNGLNSSKMLGVNFNYNTGDKLTLDGSVRWNHSNSDSWTKRSSENFVSTAASFSNSINQSYSRSDSWNAQMRLEWKPDTMTNIMFRPSLSYSTSDSRSINRSASYKEDPYLYVTDPLSAEAIDELDAKDVMVNSNTSNSINYNESKRFGGMLQYNRRLGNKGRNVTLRVDGNYSEGESNNLSTNNVHLYQVLNSMGQDSTYQTNRYRVTPTRNYNYTAQATYSEPLWKGAFLQLNYRFNYSYSKSDQRTYDFSNLGEDFFAGLRPTYRNWGSYLSRLDNPYEDYYDQKLSTYSQYKNYTHNIELMFRLIRDKYNFNVGVMLQPQTSDFEQNRMGVYTDTTRSVINFTPTLNFRYRFNKQSNLRLDYRGSTSQPGMSDLIDIYDDSDPLNISTGNPGLKPSFTNNFRAFYNTFIQNHMQTLSTYVNFNTTRNSISHKVTYNETTGGRLTRPENINGNWNIDGSFDYSLAIDTTGYWFVSTSTDLSYRNMVGFVSLDRNADSQKNVTHSTSWGERLAATYRNDWLEVELDGSFTYDRTRNQLQKQSNLDTWRFSYGGTINIDLPWGTRISTDMHQNSRRGYNDKSMNTNELVWNAQISQSFLRGKPLSVMLQFYDILDNQSNFSRSISTMQRSDTQYNSINSYVMLTAVYRLNIFGGKQSRGEMHGPGPGHERGGRGGNRPRGGRPMGVMPAMPMM
ncbi:MAG: outer membrane beta-barrel protein [Prevotella sp.]